MKRIWELAMTNVVVAMHWRAYKHFDRPESKEEMLISMVVHLAKQNENLLEQLKEFHLTRPFCGSIIVDNKE